MRDDGPPGPEPGTRSAGRADWYNKTSAASIGIEMAVAICGGALGGMWVERHWTHWAPWTTLIGLMIGIGAAALAIARLVREHERDVAARRAAEAAEAAGAAAGPVQAPSGAGPDAGGSAPGPHGQESGDMGSTGAEPGDAGSATSAGPASPASPPQGRRPRASPLPRRGPLP